MAEVQKWGFGAAPFKPEKKKKNRTVLRYLLSYIDNQPIKKNIDICI